MGLKTRRGKQKAAFTKAELVVGGRRGWRAGGAGLWSVKDSVAFDDFGVEAD